MTAATRRFVLAALTVLTLGVGAGLIAYVFDLQTSGVSAQDAAGDLQLVPTNAPFVASIDLRALMASPLWKQLRHSAPVSAESQGKFELETGISIERDIDRVVVYLAPSADGNRPDKGVMLARGRFDAGRIEALMKTHGATVEQLGGRRIMVAEAPAAADAGGQPGETFALSFVEPGLVAIGTSDLVRGAIGRQNNEPNVTANEEIMALVRSLDSGDLWAVARYEAFGADAQLPNSVLGNIPPIHWLGLSARIDDGIGGTIQVEARDAEAASNLRDMVKGFIALGKLQASSDPGLQTLLQSVTLGGSGRSVVLSFEASAALLEKYSPRP